jgi:dolichol-phosphate mannosyltransferase
MKMSAPHLSIVVPVHNEESSLPELLSRLSEVLSDLGTGRHEMLFVDDGSTDSSFSMLVEAAKRDERIRVISLSRNFGHQAAITAGIENAQGDAVVIMDADLQDTPEVIPDFVAKFSEGYDVVYATRVRRKESWLLRICYFAFYRMMTSLSTINLPLDSGDFGLMSRRVVDELKRMPEHHRYLRGLRSWTGFRQVGIAVERAGRHAGRSKYGVLGLIKLAADGLFAFSIVPIRAAALLGTFVMFGSTLFVAYSIYAKLFLRQSPKGFTALIAAVTFFSGTILFFLGVIGEYVGRIYEETKRRPLYIVQRVVGKSVLVKGEGLPAPEALTGKE